jgi:hypothetical protein
VGHAPLPIALPSTSSTANITPNHPIFSSVKKAGSFNLKVIQADMKRLPSGKIDFSHKSQTFVDINEENANVHHITSVIQRKWGSDYVVVTNDGWMIEDCSGTNGRIYLHCEINDIHMY